jgi:transcriptional regulator with XRE-family HTH domain
MSKKNLVSKALPLKLRQLMEKIGENCSLARKRRDMTMEQAARRVFVSRPTIARMENGDDRVSFGTYMTYAFVLGVEDDFRHLFAPERDEIGLWMERKKMDARQRVRPKSDASLDF